MNYTFRNIVLVINKLILYFSIASSCVFLILSALDAGHFKKWIAWFGAAAITGIIMYLLNIVRKTRLPVPGRDYL